MTKFGCTSIVEEWCNRKALTPGALHLTNQPLFAKEWQVQTSTQRPVTKRRRTTAAPALPYLDSHNQPERLFWLCQYFRDLAEQDALALLSNELSRCNRSHILQMAVIGAQGNKRNDIKTSLGYVVSDGLLPFAHARTTVFEAGEA